MQAKENYKQIKQQLSQSSDALEMIGQNMLALSAKISSDLSRSLVSRMANNAMTEKTNLSRTDDEVIIIESAINGQSWDEIKNQLSQQDEQYLSELTEDVQFAIQV